MLINITEREQVVIYNGKSRVLNPGEGIDIRDFDIETKHVESVEKHIITKRPGLFEQKPTTTADPLAIKQYVDKIRKLEEIIENMTDEIAQLKSSEKVAQDKHSASAGEVETMKRDVLSMKKEVDKYKSEKEELEEEVRELRLAVRKPKP